MVLHLLAQALLVSGEESFATRALVDVKAEVGPDSLASVSYLCVVCHLLIPRVTVFGRGGFHHQPLGRLL